MEIDLYCKTCRNAKDHKQQDNEICWSCVAMGGAGNYKESTTYADLIRGEKDDARLAALLMEIRCANCAFWGLCYRFADAERTMIEGKAKQKCTEDLYDWLRQEVGAPGTVASFPWGKTLKGAMQP